MNTPAVCPKCGGLMEEGYLLDHSHACRYVSRWIGGQPERSLFGNAKVSGRKQHEVRTFRCVTCGFLESYASGNHG